MKLPIVPVDTEYTKFKGGLDLETPPISVDPGSLLSCLNYEPGTNGGYRRIDGYERYDGQTSPSDAVYFFCETTFTDTVSVGDIVTGVDSLATGQVITVSSNYMNVTKVTGTFQAENFTVAAVPKGSIDTIPAEGGESTGALDAQALSDSADVCRLDITKPVDVVRPIRGVGLLKGTVYAFVDNLAGTAGEIYKETSSGWSQITLYNELSFDTGIAEIFDGDSITQLVSGATADVKRVVLESGTWSGSDATGRLILDNIVGVFNATNDLQVAAATKATSTSLSTTITLLPAGRYRTIEYNFYGATDLKRMYGCDGVNRGFEFDGDIYVPIDTGMTIDTPERVKAHKKQLFFSFKSSSQNSGLGEPYQWTPVTGATEIAVGDNITDYLSLPGQAMAIFARNRSDQLLGNNISDFILDVISDEVGCISHTAQKIGHAYILDDRGIVQVVPTQSYGNFRHNTISRIVQPLIDQIRQNVVASTVYRSRDQYRIYDSDGTGIIMTILDDGNVAFTNFEYPDTVSCTASGEDSTGKDVVFFGSSEGMIYQADKGSSFDGSEIEAFIQLHFNNSKSPTTLKTYRKATIELKADLYTELSYSPDFSYGDTNRPEASDELIANQGAGGYWDVSNWDEFYYDSQIVSTPSFRIDGTGTNLSITIYGNSKIDQGHKLDGAIIHYTPRRIVR